MDYPSIVRDTIDFRSDTEVCNIGYNEGVLSDDRPYRVEVWSSYGVMSATIFISVIGLEGMPEKGIKKMLIDNKIIDILNDDILITQVEDSEENLFFSINVPLEGNGVSINKLLIKIKDFDI